MTKLELMEMLRNARAVPDNAEVVLVVYGSAEVIHFDEKRVLFLVDQYACGPDPDALAKKSLDELRAELGREVAALQAKAGLGSTRPLAKTAINPDTGKLEVPCGNPDSACGLKGGSARCAECKHG